MAAIPLLCTICPKKPNFSDVSHLLTHIASKGHLSNYYKLKVRSSSEEASRRLIEAYDRWYSEWSVEELMSDRMVQKDKRRSCVKPAGTATMTRAAPASGPKIEAPIPRHPRSRAAANILDPRLYEQQMMIKVENAVTPTSTPQPGPVLRHRPFAPYLQYWPSESRASSRTGSYTNPDYETSSEYSDPSERRRYPYPARHSCAIEDDNADMIMPAPDPMAVSESTRLKGVYWPGMDIFDSATPEMRRKRNQKKDSSVVAQLELNSQEVEAMELIFTPHGSFKRQRRISSSVYDDEEDISIKAESPRSLPPRAPLAELDANIIPRPRQLTRPQLSYSLHPGYGDEHRNVGLGYAYVEQAPKRKRVFDVFHSEEFSFAQPATFNYLTAGLHQQASPTPALASTLPNHQTYDSSLYDEDKENTLPTLHQSNYDHIHHCAAPSHHYQTYSYGLEQDFNTFSYHNPVYNYSTYQQQSVQDDDQHTVTAPPSPSTA